MGLGLFLHLPGVPLRSTPGFMLAPASRVEEICFRTYLAVATFRELKTCE